MGNSIEQFIVMSIRSIIFAIGILLLFIKVTVGRITTVPQQAPTIQAGLDSLFDTDTLLISHGTYSELIFAPPFSFVIIGEQCTDSVTHAYPTIDGTLLGGHDTSAVFTFPLNSRPILKHLRIRNISRDGIRTWADSLSLFDCIFDSTDHGIYHRESNQGAIVRVEDCTFNNNDHSCLRILVGNTLFAKRSMFSGSSSDIRAVVGGGHLFLDSCHFSSEGPRLLLLSVNSGNITNCVFDSATTDPTSHEIVSLGDSQVTFKNNVLRECRYHYHTLDFVTTVPDCVVIRDNLFIRCVGLRSGASGAIGMIYYSVPENFGALILNNTFVNCGGFQTADDIWPPVDLPVLIEDNLFFHDSLNNIPSIGGSGSQWQETPAILRNNVFVECDYALDGSAQTDARFNYWGDASGPYHETDNPQGLGDTITGPVQFIPWLTDTLSAVDDSRSELPSELTLTAYPNPFNATTRLAFSITRSGQVELMLFDILGRNVKSLLSGHLQAGEHEMDVDLASLASGVYFGKLDAVDQSLVTKLVLMK